MKDFTKEELKKAFEDARKGKWVEYYTEFDRAGNTFREKYYNFDDWYSKTYDVSPSEPKVKPRTERQLNDEVLFYI